MKDAMVIDGRAVAAELTARLASAPHPGRFLAAVLAGDDRSSVSFLNQKEITARRIGVDFRLYRFPATSTKDELREEVGRIARQKSCGGVIVQLPLPEPLDWHYVLNAIPPEKDVDVLGARALGDFYTGRGAVLPPAVGAVEEILRRAGREVVSSTVAIVGLGILVGRPVANWAMRRAKQTLLLHRPSDLALLKQADIVIAGAGHAGLLRPEMLKDGAGVIDFGYDQGRGDFDPGTSGASAGASGPLAPGGFYTPTPGGTGPVLVAKLFENFYALQPQEEKRIRG